MTYFNSGLKTKKLISRSFWYDGVIICGIENRIQIVPINHTELQWFVQHTHFEMLNSAATQAARCLPPPPYPYPLQPIPHKITFTLPHINRYVVIERTDSMGEKKCFIKYVQLYTFWMEIDFWLNWFVYNIYWW